MWGEGDADEGRTAPTTVRKKVRAMSNFRGRLRKANIFQSSAFLVQKSYLSVLAESLAFGPWGSIEARTRFLSVLTSKRPRIALKVFRMKFHMFSKYDIYTLQNCDILLLRIKISATCPAESRGGSSVVALPVGKKS